jgi:hypothetical protein
MPGNHRQHNVLAVITQQLATFGLNPREWRIANYTSHVLHFQHREDESFQLLANVARNEILGLKVYSLELASL